MTNKEVLLSFERRIRHYVNKNGNVPMKDIERVIFDSLWHLDEYEKEHTPIKKFMFVEDGSVDTDELIEKLEMTNPEIKVVVYRQGSMAPLIVNTKDGHAEEAEAPKEAINDN